MPTLSQLIEMGRLEIDRPARDTLNGAYNAGGTSITLSSGAKVSVGAYIEIDLEIFHVSAKPTATTATVAGAQFGTTAASHSNGAEVLSAYRFSRNEYRRAINHVLESISSVFGKPGWDTSQSFSSTKRILEVPAVASRAIGVFEKPTDVTDLVPVPTSRLRPYPTGVVTTGQGVRLIGYNPGTGTAYVGYEEPWPELTALTDSLDSLFPADGIDVITLGVKAYLANPVLFQKAALQIDRADVRTASGVPELINALRGVDAAMTRHFLERRNELAARERTSSLAWIKGGA